jgi:hypothetical protein
VNREGAIQAWSHRRVGLPNRSCVLATRSILRPGPNADALALVAAQIIKILLLAMILGVFDSLGSKVLPPAAHWAVTVSSLD